MLLQWLWMGMAALSLGYACITGNAGQMLSAAVGGAANAVEMTLHLCAGYLLFCGFIRILTELKAQKAIDRFLRPLLTRLLPGVVRMETREAVSLNLSANLLGLGNAATPMGIRAMQLMAEEQQARPQVKHAMMMLLIINATSIQLLPTTVLTLRVAAGSAAPNAILLPSILCTLVSTLTGTLCGLLCKALERKKHG